MTHRETVQDFIRRVLGYSFAGQVRIEVDDQKAIVGSAENVVKCLDMKDYMLYVRDFQVEDNYRKITIYGV